MRNKQGKFVKGHEVLDSWKENLSKLGKGKSHSLETEFKKGIIPHNKGRTKENYEPLKKSSISLTGKKLSEKHIQSLIKSHKGKTYEGMFGKEQAEKRKQKSSERMSGEKNPSWLGGKSFEPYDKTFNNKFKRAIRKRDNQVCMLCGIHKEKIKKTLAVHHINYNKLLSVPQNCISLCRKCHGLTTTNREHYTGLFQNLLFKLHGYQYLDNEIILEVNNG